MKYGFAIALTAALVAAPFTRAQAKPELDPNQTVRQTIIGERDCNADDRRFALLAESTGLLANYGYQTLPTGSCRAVSLSWLPSAQIVQVSGWQNHDVFVQITILRKSPASDLKLIPVQSGLSVSLNAENDPHNKAIFNELLREAQYIPSETQMIDLAALYMFLVGHPPDERLRKLSEVMMISDMIGTTQTDGDDITVELHQRLSPKFSTIQPNWKLYFTESTKQLRLLSVAPATS